MSAYDAVNSILSGACDAQPSGGAATSSKEISEELITPMLHEIERGCVALAPYALDVMRLPA